MEGTSLGMLKDVQFGLKIFASSPVAYITVDVKKFVSDLFLTGSALVESESVKRKTKLSEKPRNMVMTSKRFHMQYRSTLQYISLTLHCKYPVKSLWDQCKFVFEEVKKTSESTKQ